MGTFQSDLAEAASAVDDMLERLLPKPDGPEARVQEAMRYAAFPGGKRLRPFFVVQSAKLFSVDEDAALRVAAAIECVHLYSLIHDDLPAMDDDDMRHGKPTAHKAFDEATAILAGDALLTLAFEILASDKVHGDARVRVELIRMLTHAAGSHGMVGGQMIDIEAPNLEPSLTLVTRLQYLKTGALIAASCEAGAVLGKAPAAMRQALHSYAHDMGLAFQMADDLLDVSGDAEKMGKAVGKDAAAGKATFVTLMGEERARAQATMLAQQAGRHLDPFGAKAAPLRDAALWVVERDH
ncbi:MAG: polyprenyl synthetase family protein [Alphaproteobacteria bacterium]